jgi:hypothetical protein
MSAVKIVTNKPTKAPKAEKTGEIKDVKVPVGPLKVMSARGMGAAKKGGKFLGV